MRSSPSSPGRGNPGRVPRRRLTAALLALALASTAGAPVPPAGAQGTLSALETDVDQIARSARPSVVTVIAQSRASVSTEKRGQRRQRVLTHVGTGVAVEESSVLTTASVVFAAERVWVRTTNELQVEAQVIGLDPIFNLALLRVADIRLPALRFSTGRAPQEGDWAMAIGTSHYRAQITQSVGSIAYRHRDPRLALLELTNAVFPGYSGGAVVDARGQLIGIVQGEMRPYPLGGQAYDGDRGAGGMSFVLPVETVVPVYESLRTEGRVPHGYLGVSTRGASVESDTRRGLRVPIGALVESVRSDGPAAHGGLRRGDLIVGFDGERVEYPDQLARWVAATRPGVAVDLVWVRDEIRRSGRIALSESPEAMPQWAALPGAPAGEGQAAARIADLERQIQRLNRELEHLKIETASAPR